MNPGSNGFALGRNSKICRFETETATPARDSYENLQNHTRQLSQTETARPSPIQIHDASVPTTRPKSAPHALSQHETNNANPRSILTICKKFSAQMRPHYMVNVTFLVTLHVVNPIHFNLDTGIDLAMRHPCSWGEQ